MAENKQTTPETIVPDEPVIEIAPTRLQAFVTRHPKAAKVVAITGAGLAAVGVVQVARTVKANKSHLEAAGEHMSEAASELSSSVTPASPEA